MVGIGLIAFAFSAANDGSLADRVVDRAAKAFVNRIADSAAANDERRRSRAERDAIEIGEAVTAIPRAGKYPKKINRLGYAVGTGRRLSAGNHLDSYKRLRRGFRVCVVNVSGAWAAWETTRAESGIVATDTLGGACNFK